MIFSDNLKKYRNEKQLTQEKLAELLNVSRQAVSKWESGQGYPEVDKLIKLSELFEVSLDDLLKEPSNQQMESHDVNNTAEKQTVTLWGTEINPDIALKMFWGGAMLGAIATIAAFFNN